VLEFRRCLFRSIDTGIPMRITHGITDEEACAVGLTCGGTVHLFVERLDY
jgi:xanthine dehydrogenase accessory factor